MWLRGAAEKERGNPMIYFTAGLDFHHEKIIRHTGLPFHSVNVPRGVYGKGLGLSSEQF